MLHVGALVKMFYTKEETFQFSKSVKIQRSVFDLLSTFTIICSDIQTACYYQPNLVIFLKRLWKTLLIILQMLLSQEKKPKANH